MSASTYPQQQVNASFGNPRQSAIAISNENAQKQNNMMKIGGTNAPIMRTMYPEVSVGDQTNQGVATNLATASGIQSENAKFDCKVSPPPPLKGGKQNRKYKGGKINWGCLSGGKSRKSRKSLRKHKKSKSQKCKKTKSKSKKCKK